MMDCIFLPWPVLLISKTVQEEERLAVQDHLQTMVANTTIWGQASAPKATPVPQVPFYELWHATESFSEK
jgi:hypothetical protein